MEPIYLFFDFRQFYRILDRIRDDDGLRGREGRSNDRSCSQPVYEDDCLGLGQQGNVWAAVQHETGKVYVCTGLSEWCIIYRIFFLTKDEEVKNPVLIVSRSHTGDVQTIAKEVFGKNVHIIKAGGAGWSYF